MYNGIFNLLVLRGARDWMTGNVPQYGDLDRGTAECADHGDSSEQQGRGLPVGSEREVAGSATLTRPTEFPYLCRGRVPPHHQMEARTRELTATKELYIATAHRGR